MLLQGPKADMTSFYSNNVLNEEDKKDPEKVGGAFEAIFYRMILKESMKSHIGDEILGSKYVEKHREAQYEEMAQVLGNQGHLGIKKMIVEHIEKLNGENTVHPEQFQEVFYGKVEKSKQKHLGLLK